MDDSSAPLLRLFFFFDFLDLLRLLGSESLEHSLIHRAGFELGRCLIALGHRAEAEPLLRESFERLRPRRPKAARRAAATLASLYAEAGDEVQAAPFRAYLEGHRP